MRELLTSGAVGNIEYNAQKKIRENINNKITYKELQKLLKS